MTYLVILEAITVLLAFFVKLVAFYFLIKLFNQTVKFLTTVKSILLYELGTLIFILIIPRFSNFQLFNSPLYLFFGLLYFLFFIAVLFFIFYFIMRKLSLLSLKKSLIVFLVIFLIITPLILFSQTKISNLIFTETSAELIPLYDFAMGQISFQDLPPVLKILHLLNFPKDSLLENKFLHELWVFAQYI